MCDKFINQSQYIYIYFSKFYYIHEKKQHKNENEIIITSHHITFYCGIQK